MKIEVVGPGCAKCNLLEATTKAAADKLGIDYQIEHVRNISEFAKRGVLFTPGLTIDGKLVVSGRVPSEAEITTLLTSALPK